VAQCLERYICVVRYQRIIVVRRFTPRHHSRAPTVAIARFSMKHIETSFSFWCRVASKERDYVHTMKCTSPSAVLEHATTRTSLWKRLRVPNSEDRLSSLNTEKKLAFAEVSQNLGWYKSENNFFRPSK